MPQAIPQVRVFQEFRLIPTAIVNPLRAFVFGPHFDVRTYAKAKASIGIGAYDKAVDTTYSYPQRAAGEVVDLAGVELVMDAADIRYFEDAAGAGTAFAPVAPNIVQAGSTFGFASYDGFTRSGLLPKNVEVGDYVKLTNPNNIADVLTSVVRGIVREPVAATIGTPYVDAANADTQVASVSPVSAPTTDIVATLNADNYDGSVDGQLTDRYTLRVTASGESGAATLDVISDSGLDDASGVVITLGSPLTIGARGLTVTFAKTGTGSSSSSTGTEGEVQFLAGQEWVFDVDGNFDAVPAPIASGTYTGETSTTYIVTVTSGGDGVAQDVQLSVSTADGVDNAVIAVDAADLLDEIAIGAYGLKLFFGPGSLASAGDTSSSSTGDHGFGYRLCKGDRFYVAVVAAGEGRGYQLELADSLSDTMLLQADLDIEIYARRNGVAISRTRYGSPATANFTPDSNEVIVASGITFYTASGADAVLNGEPIVAGTMYLGYRALMQDWVREIQTIDDAALLTNYFTDLSPDNPLGFGVKQALVNANGTAVKFIAVATDDITGYTNAVKKTLEREDVYGFVPLTYDTAIKAMVVSHVSAQSSEEKGRWRKAWLSVDTPSTKRVIGDAGTVKATITRYSGDTTGYRLVTAPGAGFITNAVTAGDELRYNFGVDGLGNTTYTTDVVDAVLSESQLLVLTGPAVPNSIAAKIEVWRTLDAQAQVDELIAANTYGSRRVNVVLGGDGLALDGYTGVADYYLGALYAGLRSGVAPHQGLTNVAISGVDDVPFQFVDLNGEDLDRLANAGFWLTSRDPVSGDIFCRKQLTSDVSSTNTAEDSITTNLDSISYYFKSVLKPFIGRTNNVQSVHNLIRAEIEAGIQYFKNVGVGLPTLGGQIVAGTVDELRPHATQPDRLVVRVSLTLPYPLNELDLYLVV